MLDTCASNHVGLASQDKDIYHRLFTGLNQEPIAMAVMQRNVWKLMFVADL